MVTDTQGPPFEARESLRRGRASLPSLLGDLVDQTRTLLRQELSLARAEITEKAAGVSCNLTTIAVGGAIALVGAITLAAAASAGLWSAMVYNGVSEFIALWLAPLIVGGIVGLIGYVMIHSGMARLRNTTVVPEKTAASLKETGRWMQDKVS